MIDENLAEMPCNELVELVTEVLVVTESFR